LDKSSEKPRALGRGLAALIPTAAAQAHRPAAYGTIKREHFECAIEDIYPSKENPRQHFDDKLLGELADSIRVQGLVQPLVVRARPENEGGGFYLIAGERRFRAAQRAGLKTVPVVVKDVTPKAAFELAIVENLQRADLNPIEEAQAFDRLQTEHGYTQEQLAERVGKERATVANSLRLLKLPAPVRAHVVSGALSMGQARALLGLDAVDAIERAAERVVQKGLSVRQTEELVRREKAGAAAPKKVAPVTSAGVRDLEQRLERSLGTRVRLDQSSAHAGKIVVDYHSLDQLDSLIAKLVR
jgi:ParB family chromosome partitioning protein